MSLHSAWKLVADLEFAFSSFLPQDKVSEFAHMSPQQLLRETQRAASDPRLTNWHDTLITAGKEMAQLGEVGDVPDIASQDQVCSPITPDP